jgi:hypothetical protein
MGDDDEENEDSMMDENECSLESIDIPQNDDLHTNLIKTHAFNFM